MMRSLFSGVSGLKVHQTKMDVIGNNIANVNTVGFKASSVTFDDVFYQTSQSATGPNKETGMGGQNAKQIGLGASLGAIAVNITRQGGSQRTDNPFDLMINGDSFFIVNKGGTNYFTKAGNFNVDEAGNLVNSSGYSVMGWKADDDGKILKDRVSALQVMGADQMHSSPIATTKSTFYGNINSEDEKFLSKEVRNQNIPIQMSFYDARGYEYEAMFHIRKGTNPGEFTMNLFSVTKDGEVIEKAAEVATAPGYTYLGDQITLKFNTGKSPLYYDSTGAQLTPTGTPPTLSDADKARVAYEIEPGQLISAQKAGGTATGPVFDVEMNFTSTATPNPYEAVATPITVNFSGMTNYGSTSNVDTKKGYEEEGAGRAAGAMSSLGVQTDGKIVASYDNGDKRILGQIAVANFANAAGLEKMGENLYAETLNSGEFNGIGADITADGGKFSTGVLEMSNVDLSTEFVDMITTQRGFQANSRIITTSDSMLEELINLKR